MPSLKHYDDLRTARFITFSTYHRLKLLQTSPAPEIIVEQLARLRGDSGVRILAYVIMPDHVHLVLVPPDGQKMGIEIGRFKARSAKAILAERGRLGLHIPKRGSHHSAIWQRRCYDHNCRTPEATLEKIVYCHNNPVASRLVREPGEWEYSSYRWYQGERNVPLEIDHSGRDL